MNAERLDLMATMLDEVAAGTWTPSASPVMAEKDTPVVFHLDDWIEVVDSDTPACGYSACAIGHVMLDSRFGIGGTDQPIYEGAAHWKAVMEYFDLTEWGTHFLFYSAKYPNKGKTTAAEVAARIRRFIADA